MDHDYTNTLRWTGGDRKENETLNLAKGEIKIDNTQEEEREIDTHAEKEKGQHIPRFRYTHQDPAGHREKEVLMCI